MVLEELAEVPLVAILADHVEWVAVGNAYAHHADQVRVIETGQDSCLLDEISPENKSCLAGPREALVVLFLWKRSKRVILSERRDSSNLLEKNMHIMHL